MENLIKRLNRKAKGTPRPCLSAGRRAGFTLVELLVVIAIIAILSVTAYVALGGQTAKARNSKRMQDLGAIQNALEIYFVENYSKYPDQLADNSNPADVELEPKYMPELPTDPIPTNPYEYGIAGNKKTYQLATTLEEEDGSHKAYVIGNGTNLIDGDACGGGTPCKVTDGGTCVAYCP